MGFGSQLGGRGREFAGIVLRKSLTHDRSRLLTGSYHGAAVFGLACSVSIRIQSQTFKCGSLQNASLQGTATVTCSCLNVGGSFGDVCNMESELS